MKNNFIKIILILLFAFQTSKAQESIIISELRFGNGTPVYWENNIKCKFYYLNDKVRKDIKTKLNQKELYYKKSKGTEIILYIPNNAFDSQNNIQVFAEYYTTLEYNAKEIDSKRDYIISKSNLIPIGSNTSKLNHAIEITSPELFSLTVMINYLDKKLNRTSNRDDGFVNTIDKFENFKDDFYNDGRVKYETLIEFYKLMVFLEEFAEENSFFNDEGKKLSEHISLLNYQLSNSTKDATNVDAQQEILDDLVKSNIVYQEYLKTKSLISKQYLGLQLILFLKSKQ